jgi:6-phosphofructokinase 1
VNTFISFCLDDVVFAVRVSYYLQDQSNLSPYCYVDERNHESWPDQIDEAMAKSDAFVLIAGSRLGKTQIQEAERAQNRSLKLVRVTLPGAPEEVPFRLGLFASLDPVVVESVCSGEAVDETSAQRCAHEIAVLLLGKGGWHPQFGIPDGYPFSYEKKIIEEFVAGHGRLSPERLEQGCPDAWPQVEKSTRDFRNPVSETRIGKFSDEGNHVFVDARARRIGSQSQAAADSVTSSLTFAEARPRRALRFPDPQELASHYNRLSVGIVVSGGIAPGINAVIAGIVGRHLLYQESYKEKNKKGYLLKILGFRDGFKSLLTEDAPPHFELSAGSKLQEVRDNSSRGGSLLGTSRLDELLNSSNPKNRADKFDQMARCLRGQGIRILYVIGGDGTMRAAHALHIAARQINYQLVVAAIPKTMDNDILWVWQSFGFLSAVEKAKEFIMQVHTEASSNPRVCVMQLFGSDSGFVVSHAALASGVVNLALIPEIEFSMEQVCDYLLQRLEGLFEQGRSPYGVVVMSETAIPMDVDRYIDDPEMRLEKEERKEIENFIRHERRVRGQTPDALRTGGLKIVSRVLQRKLEDSPDKHWTKLRVFTNEPRHLLRSLEPSAADVIFGQRLGCLAVDNAMAGYDDFMVSQWMTEFVLVPLALVVLGRKRVPPDGIFWRSVLASTGQPPNLNKKASTSAQTPARRRRDAVGRAKPKKVQQP